MSGKAGMTKVGSFKPLNDETIRLTTSTIYASRVSIADHDYDRIRALNIRLLLGYWHVQSKEAQRRAVWSVQNLISQMSRGEHQNQVFRLIANHPINKECM